ncbi:MULTISPECIES: hypothetical protein [unclassified Psychrobacillus]|uniref:hypothetical protein n=1 Tax=unclassified Psychrobacillus TaxID=2636677 RepID=UPI00146AF401|nr:MULTISPECIES: hypothetical protein [unclassified Psychrobacillus]MCM3360137.1 hypothetical protein [Psychrobacillus sp. MER TA 171]NME07413.1 hypothetical protein [Psychrobacillus sp. BL-248-WT-3]
MREAGGVKSSRNRTTEADEEICRPSGFAATDGSWRVALARVGSLWATKGSRHPVIGGGFFYFYYYQSER